MPDPKGELPAQTDPASAAVVRGYLANWAARRTGRGTATTFDVPGADAWVAAVYAQVARAALRPAARAVASEQVVRHARTAAAQPSPNTNALAYVLLGSSEDLAVADVVAQCISAGAAPQATRAFTGLLWRAAVLARLGSADGDLTTLLERMEASAGRHIDPQGGRLRGWARGSEGAGTGSLAQLVWALASAAEASGSARLSDAGRDALERLRAVLSGDTLRSTSTSDLSQALLAAATSRDEDLSTSIIGELLGRLDHDRGILHAERDSTRYETSAWPALALAWAARTLPGIDDALDPRTEPPPSYVITTVRTDSQGLRIEADDAGRTFTRRLDTSDLNLLLSQFADHLNDDLSPRLQAHAVVGMLDLLERSPAPRTRERLETQMHRSLELILATQQANGGWAYGRSAQASVVHSATGSRRTVFPDLQYTLDTAVPGIALCRAHGATGDPRLLHAAERGFAFLEDEVGRIDFRGRPIWRLYPDDRKTAVSGTAVNYELWVGAFLARVGALTTDDASRRRIASYIDDIVSYSEALTDESGDIAYGDYVRELRTPYAAWDALLLAEIARVAGHAGAGRLAERILDRLATVLLPSGAMPNVVDYERVVDGHPVLSTHRHGIGPFPLRSYYQLYFVAAAAPVGRCREEAARAFGFVALEMLVPAFGSATAGYGARGVREASPTELSRIGRDWLLTAAATLPWLTGLDYRPDFDAVLTESERLQTVLAELREALAAGGPAPPTAPEHPLATTAEEILSSVRNGQPAPDDSVRRLIDRQRPNGLWPSARFTSGDESCAEILVPLVRARGQARLGDALEQAIERGLDGAWKKLFHPRKGVGFSTAHRLEPMRPELAAEFALAFATSARASGPDNQSGGARARLVMRHLIAAHRQVDGGYRFSHRGEPLAIGNRMRLLTACEATVALLVPEPAG